ncbi:MAG TPA: zf-HC2 domain-containing protein [Bryobacteraceae bacterium]|nr:zf-HC2 domain-containing protein [Bryobacteraceae bacterium]
MDHETAVRIQAAERYVLEEFPPEERAAFEEHFFECPECAEGVRSASIFAANASQALKDERSKEKAKLESGRGRPNRRFWWTLAASAALNVVLVAGIGLERFGSHATEAGIEPQFYPTVAVAAASRGSQSTAALSAGARFFGVRFDLMPGQHFQSFEYQILDAQGTLRSAKSLAAPAGESSELQLAVPVASLDPGEYVLELRGKLSGDSTEIGRRAFAISR